MLRRTLITISATLLLITVIAWGASYWNWWFAGDDVVVWLRQGGVEWSNDYLQARQEFSPLLQSFVNLQDRRGSSCGMERHTFEWAREVLDSTVSARTRGRDGYSGAATNWMPEYRREPVFDSSRVAANHAIAPLWIPALVFAVLPACSFVSWVRSRWRTKHGLCVSCSYDLRGTKGACPECGVSI